LKTSFHRKIALRNATGISHPDHFGQRFEPSKGDSLCSMNLTKYRGSSLNCPFESLSKQYKKHRQKPMLFIWLGMRDSNPRSWDQNPVFEEHPDENYLFYLDVSFGETLKRHQSRPEKADFGVDEMKRWWDYASPTSHLTEKIIPESSSLAETLKTIRQVTGL
jgi:hypothetical protein